MKKSNQTLVGLSITPDAVQAVLISPKVSNVDHAVTIPMPDGLMNRIDYKVTDTVTLSKLIKEALSALGHHPASIHLSLPTAMIRMIELPAGMDNKQLQLSLSSEAERYRLFDNTEAVVDFVALNHPPATPGMKRLIFTAIRSDALTQYLKAFQLAKVKVASLDFASLDILRAMAAIGILDNLIEQIGEENYWGCLFVERDHIQFMIWQGNVLHELRDVQFDSLSLSLESSSIFDLLDEIRRTAKSYQPVIWLADNLPPEVCQVLSDHLMRPFSPCTLSNQINLPPNIGISAFGAAMRTVNGFPFNLNLLRNASSNTVSAASPEKSGETDSQASLAFAGGIAVSLVMIFIWIGLWFATHFFVESQVNQLEEKKSGKLASINLLNSQISQYKTQHSTELSILDVIQNARNRNAMYLALSEDLMSKTPKEMWIQTVKVDQSLNLEGKALNNQSVLDFARSFDNTAYANALMVNEIKEENMSGTPVYNFKIGGPVESAALQALTQPAAPSGSNPETPAVPTSTTAPNTGSFLQKPGDSQAGGP